MGGMIGRKLAGGLTGIVALALACAVAQAERLENQVAVFSGLDKVTARISKFEVELGKTATFGSLKVTPRACYSRTAREQPKTTTFVEVDELQLDGKEKRIFTGWMFAESPGLFGVEHPTTDVWLTECQKPKNVAVQKPADAVAAKPKAAAGGAGTAAKTAPSDGGDAVGEVVDPAFDPTASEPEALPEQTPRRRVRR